MPYLKAATLMLVIVICGTAVAEASMNPDQLTEAQQRQNLYDVALTMENKMKAKLATLKEGTPEYAKLKDNLAKVSQNRYGLGRAIPGSEEAKQEQQNPTGSRNSYSNPPHSSSAPGGDPYKGSDWTNEKARREANLKGIWESTFETADTSFGAFYMFKFNDLDRVETVADSNTQDWMLMQLPTFEVTERLRYQDQISPAEKLQFARILKGAANRGYPKLRAIHANFLPIGDQQLFSQITGELRDRAFRESLLTAYVSGMNPLNMPGDMFYQGLVAEAFLNQLAPRARRDFSARQALTNLYLCTRVKSDDANFIKFAARVEAAFKKYVGTLTCDGLLSGPNTKPAGGFLGNMRQKLLGR